MNWPWVSRLAFDLVCAERDRIAEQNEKLVSHFSRIERTDHGLHELPKEQRPSLEPMPPELATYIASFAFPAYRREMRNLVYRRHQQGTPWSVIVEEMREGQTERKAEEDDEQV